MCQAPWLGGELGSKGANGSCQTTEMKEGRQGHSLKTPETPLKFSRRKAVKRRFSSDVDTELKYIVLSFQTGREYLGIQHFFTCGFGVYKQWDGKVHYLSGWAFIYPPSLFHFFLSSLTNHMFIFSFCLLPSLFLPLLAILHRYSQPGPWSWLPSLHIIQ